VGAAFVFPPHGKPRRAASLARQVGVPGGTVPQ
jgi:hypothetical protein